MCYGNDISSSNVLSFQIFLSHVLLCVKVYLNNSTTFIYNMQYYSNLLEVSLLEQSFWHSSFHSCFPHFIKASTPAEACYSAENRQSRGFHRQPIKFFPHSHSARFLMRGTGKLEAKHLNCEVLYSTLSCLW